MNWVFRPSESVFGFGVINKIPDFIQRLGASRVLMVTDKGVREAGVLEQVVDTIEKAVKFDLFDKVKSEPSHADLEKTMEFTHKEYEAIIAVGGGSCIDFAKATSLLLTYGGTLVNYIGEGMVPGPVLPHHRPGRSLLRSRLGTLRPDRRADPLLESKAIIKRGEAPFR